MNITHSIKFQLHPHHLANIISLDYLRRYLLSQWRNFTTRPGINCRCTYEHWSQSVP